MDVLLKAAFLKALYLIDSMTPVDDVMTKFLSLDAAVEEFKNNQRLNQPGHLEIIGISNEE